MEVAGERRAMHFYRRGPYLPRWSARCSLLLPSRRFFRTGFTARRRCNKPVLPFLLCRLPRLRCVHNVENRFYYRRDDCFTQLVLFSLAIFLLDLYIRRLSLIISETYISFRVTEARNINAAFFFFFNILLSYLRNRCIEMT